MNNIRIVSISDDLPLHIMQRTVKNISELEKRIKLEY